MTNSNRFRRLILVVVAVAAVISFEGVVAAQAQISLFRQRPVSTAPGRHGRLAHIGDVDEGMLSLSPEHLTIEVPGKPALSAQRVGMDRRGTRNMVWRGRLQSEPASKVSFLSRRVSSSGRVTSCRHLFALRLMTPHGALASLRGRRQAAS